MKSKIEEYLLDFIEKELSAAEAASVAAEIAGSAKLAAEVADIQAVRAEIKNTQNAIPRGVDLAKLHAKIMYQVENL
jgi:anti-sigma factor RsiW